jgi:hypothetical protein
MQPTEDEVKFVNYVMAYDPANDIRALVAPTPWQMLWAGQWVFTWQEYLALLVVILIIVSVW